MAERILRFHPADKVFHGVNAITWFALLFTGVAVYFGNLADETANNLMIWHIGIAVVYTFNLIGFLVFAPHRFAAMLNALLTWDMNTIKWFRNVGGYPRRFFKIPFGPEEVPPQGRYNGGQKMSYLIFLFMMYGLAVTGWLLFYFAPAIPKGTFWWMYMFHVWGSIICSLMVVCAHIPLALLSWEHFKGIWGIGEGTISYEAAEHHAPTWLEKDVIRTNLEQRR